jgi:dipeptidyl aminopeptidase/acylaminoacyl peptidase
MMALKRVSDPAPSPDGKWVAFSAVDVNLESNTRTPHIWIVPMAGGEERQLTNGKGEQRPRWSPDGKHFAYISEDQVHVLDFDSASGKAEGDRQVTNISTGADGELWSPDGKNILFVSEVYPDCADDACNKQRDQDKEKSKVKALMFTRLLYRHWNRYSEGKRSHLFVVPAEGGKALDLTPGDYDAPQFSLGGPDGYAFSPDGQEVCFSSNHDPVEATSTNNDLFLVPVTGGEAKNITAANKASDSGPQYSPDGKYIAYLAQVRPGYESDRFRLMLYERATGNLTNLSEKFDGWVGTFAWAPKSDGLAFVAEDKGEQPIYSVWLHGPGIEEVIRGHYDELTITEGAGIIATRVSVERPSEVYQVACGHGECSSVALTHMNDAVFAKVDTSPLEPFWFTGAAGKKVQGFIVRPPNFDAKTRYPVKFLIHGGPQGAWGDSWSYRWNPQMFAADGYVVVMINPRGSTGYGQQFIDDINGDWGGKVFTDLMLGLDYAERKYPYLDKSRECALGASYGGYMINWIEGHSTRFRCLVSHDGMFNSESAWGTTEELWFNEWEFRGTPWTSRLVYRKWSPHLSAASFKTPMLVIHGQKDYRLDVSEGLQLFTTLQRRGVASKMLYFPDEGHWVLKPQNGRLWYKTVNEWVDSYLKPAGK